MSKAENEDPLTIAVDHLIYLYEEIKRDYKAHHVASYQERLRECYEDINIATEERYQDRLNCNMTERLGDSRFVDAQLQRVEKTRKAFYDYDPNAENTLLVYRTPNPYDPISHYDNIIRSPKIIRDDRIIDAYKHLDVELKKPNVDLDQLALDLVCKLTYGPLTDNERHVIDEPHILTKEADLFVRNAAKEHGKGGTTFEIFVDWCAKTMLKVERILSILKDQKTQGTLSKLKGVIDANRPTDKRHSIVQTLPDVATKHVSNIERH